MPDPLVNPYEHPKGEYETLLNERCRGAWAEGAAAMAADRDRWKAMAERLGEAQVFIHNGEDGTASVAHTLSPGDSVTFHDVSPLHIRFDPDLSAMTEGSDDA